MIVWDRHRELVIKNSRRVGKVYPTPALIAVRFLRIPFKVHGKSVCTLVQTCKSVCSGGLTTSDRLRRKKISPAVILFPQKSDVREWLLRVRAGRRRKVLTRTYLELIEFFTLFVWVLNGFIACLLLFCLGAIAWLCYSELRDPKSDK